ncbi:IS110 family transposase [Desulfobacter vibrioformis]|uniref:IS110 family transposase n=1 Tax=Desulfobacter vibrioformis TaxID=34031 RepID=UPI00054D3D45|nr:transposase [Desulfobacter vibrioformis]
MISAIAKCVAGLDIHKAIIVCTLLQEDSDGQLVKQTKEYKTFRHDIHKLAKWLKTSDVELIVMESTGVYWKQTYEALEDEELKGKRSINPIFQRGVFHEIVGHLLTNR